MKGDHIVNLFPRLVFQLVRSPNLNTNQLAFRIHKSMNKFEIKGYLERVYGFEITDVRTANFLGKLKRGKFGLERKPGFKKAVVTVKDLCWSYPEIEKSDNTRTM